MAHREEGQNLERLFTLTEANQLLPELEDHLTAVKQGKAVLVKTKEEIGKAGANASLGGGSVVGPHYIHALEQINEHLQAIQETGVLVKEVDSGLCDFPCMLDGRIVFLCWKLGEPQIEWWHEVHTGFAGRQRVEGAPFR
jgi:hypothetical protein